MFDINIKEEVEKLVEQVYQQTGKKIEDPVVALMEWAMKMGIIKVGLALVNFEDSSEIDYKK